MRVSNANNHAFLYVPTNLLLRDQFGKLPKDDRVDIGRTGIENVRNSINEKGN
jgi:hypothetical protein